MTERKSQLSVSEEEVRFLIRRKTQGNPSQRAELQTRATILGPMLRGQDHLGMSDKDQETIRRYARRAGQAAKRNVNEQVIFQPDFEDPFDLDDIEWPEIPSSVGENVDENEKEVNTEAQLILKHIVENTKAEVKLI